MKKKTLLLISLVAIIAVGLIAQAGSTTRVFTKMYRTKYFYNPHTKEHWLMSTPTAPIKNMAGVDEKLIHNEQPYKMVITSIDTFRDGVEGSLTYEFNGIRVIRGYIENNSDHRLSIDLSVKPIVEQKINGKWYFVDRISSSISQQWTIEPGEAQEFTKILYYIQYPDEYVYNSSEPGAEICYKNLPNGKYRLLLKIPGTDEYLSTEFRLVNSQYDNGDHPPCY